MGKAILTIDEMPTVCCDCVGCYKFDELSLGSYTYKKVFRCRFIRLDNEENDGCLEDILNTKPNWCPLKEMPKKIDYIGFPSDRYWYGYVDGFDRCINDIDGNQTNLTTYLTT